MPLALFAVFPYLPLIIQASCGKQHKLELALNSGVTSVTVVRKSLLNGHLYTYVPIYLYCKMKRLFVFAHVRSSRSNQIRIFIENSCLWKIEGSNSGNSNSCDARCDCFAWHARSIKTFAVRMGCLKVDLIVVAGGLRTAGRCACRIRLRARR